MRALGRTIMVILVVGGITGILGGVYLYTLFEIEKTAAQEARAQIKELKEQISESRSDNEDLQRRIDELKEALPVGSEAASSTPDASVSSLEPADDQNGDIQVTAPAAGESVGSPIRVAGRAIAFESVVSIRIIDESGNILAESSTLTNAPDAGQFGDFSVAVDFAVPAGKGTVEVFENSARDGSEINKVSIPVVFAQ